MNIELAYNILEILQTMQGAVGQMKEQYSVGNRQMFDRLSMDLWDGLIAVQEAARVEVPKGSDIRLEDACTCALESLKDIKRLALTKPEKVEWKLEYELSAIVEVTAMQFYYWGIVDAHPEKREEFREYIASTETFGILKIPEEEREYPCDLTIAVTAYNHLDYTMRCVQSILENLPQNIKYELILFNHGSSDDTKAYFESIEEAKTINVAVNRVMPAVTQKAISRGRYHLQISNDIIIGKKAIENLYRCVMEHPDYGYVVPTTPAVSNLQTVYLNYDGMEQFLEATLRNNIYDEKRHEQRVRLCNPIHIMPIIPLTQLSLDLYEDKCCSRLFASFPDDRNSLWMRRNGYKCILAKDAYCHHFGSVTLKSDLGSQLEQERFYRESREIFQRQYGVDPWGTGFCFDPQLADMWAISASDHVAVLGINCGLGSNSLKVKEILREKGAKDIRLYNCTQEARFLEDLRGISDAAFMFQELSEIRARTGRKYYDYIVVEEAVQGYTEENLIQGLTEAGLDFRQVAYKGLDGRWKIYSKNQ